MVRKAPVRQRGEELFKEKRDRAAELLQSSDMALLLNDRDIPGDRTAGIALKAVLAERAADLVMGARKIARKNRMKRVGAAAIIIAAAQ